MRGARAPEPPPPDAAKPSPVIRRVPTPSGTILPPAATGETPPAGARPMVYPTQAAAPASTGTGHLSVSHSQLVVAGIVVVCLCAISFFVGQRFGGPEIPLPKNVEKKPTFPDIRSGPTAPNLVTPTPSRSALSETVPGRAGAVIRPGAPAGGGRVAVVEPSGGPVEAALEPTEAGQPSPAGRPAVVPAAPSGLPYRVRILQLSVSQSHAVDQLRDYLAQRGVETDLEARGGNYILFSRERFPDLRKSDEAVAQVRKWLGAFEKEFRIPTSKDAYSVKMTKE
jgi:hypothetical protein